MTAATSRSSHSLITLLCPYGLSGAAGVSSSTISASGVPYHEALPENRKLAMPRSATASSSTWIPVTLARKNSSGCSTETPAYFRPARCTTPEMSCPSKTRATASGSATDPSTSSTSSGT